MSDVAFDPDCDLCEAARYTHWYHEDDLCWIADCEVCSVPMVVWKPHGTAPSADEIERMMGRLTEAGTLRFGVDGFQIDREMRQIPDHFHAHARDPQWWQQRMMRPMTRYTGVAGPRTERI